MSKIEPTEKDNVKWEIAKIVDYFMLFAFLVFIISIFTGFNQHVFQYKVKVTAIIEKQYEFSTREEAEYFLKNKISNDLIKQSIGYIDSLDVTNAIIIDLKEEENNH